MAKRPDLRDEEDTVEMTEVRSEEMVQLWLPSLGSLALGNQRPCGEDAQAATEQGPPGEELRPPATAWEQPIWEMEPFDGRSPSRQPDCCLAREPDAEPPRYGAPRAAPSRTV